jgi:hypothetical protein
MMNETLSASDQHRAWKSETWLLARDFSGKFGRDDANKRIAFALEQGIPEDNRLRIILEASLSAPAGEQGMLALCDLMRFCEYDASKFQRLWAGIMQEAAAIKQPIPATVLPDLPYVRDLRARVDQVISTH